MFLPKLSILEALEGKVELNLLDFKESLSGNTERWVEYINAFENILEYSTVIFGINKYTQCVN